MPLPRRNRAAPETQRQLKLLGGWLLKLREEQGLSQREVGERLGGRTKVFVSQIETGRSRIPDAIVSDYAAALAADPAPFARTLLAHYEPEAHRLIFGASDIEFSSREGGAALESG